MRSIPLALAWLDGHDPVAVVAWRDPAVERTGHPALGRYAETYWLPVLGPTSLWALRRLAGWLTDRPGGFPLPLGRFADELGLGHGRGQRGPHVRALARLVAFDMARIDGDRLAVRLAVPTMHDRLIDRLPNHLAALHPFDAAPEPLPSPRCA